MAIEVKDRIEAPRRVSGRWADFFDAFDKAPIGGGIQDTVEKLGFKKNDPANLRISLLRKYGEGTFSFSQACGMITIIRLKETL